MNEELKGQLSYDQMHGVRYPYLTGKIKSLVGKDAVIIDYGALTGGVVKLLRKDGYNPIALEIRESVKEANLKGFYEKEAQIVIIEPAPGPLPFRDASVDLIIFTDVIEHFSCSPLPLMLEFKRVLRPGGYFLMTTDNVFRLLFRLQYFVGINIFQDLDRFLTYPRHRLHHRQYSLSELKRIITDYMNFQVVASRYLNFAGGRTKFRRMVEWWLYLIPSIVPPLRNTLYIIGRKP